MGRWEMPHPENLVGYSFIIKEKAGRGRRMFLSFLSRHHVSIINSSPRIGRKVYLFHPIWLGQDCHRPSEKYFQVSIQWGSFILKSHLPINDCFCVCTEPILGVFNLLSSLDTMWVSCHHYFIVWGRVSCFCCMVLLLRKLDGFVVKQTCFLQ